MATRPQGYGNPKGGVNVPPTGMPDLSGTTDRQAKVNKSTPVDVDAPFYGNVRDCCSPPVTMGRGKSK